MYNTDKSVIEKTISKTDVTEYNEELWTVEEFTTKANQESRYNELNT